MILSEKITKLRKQNGWSQEDLAMKLNISRQSVSKWESGSSVPDLDKILKLSKLFGVSTDYLLKDEIGEAGPEVFNAYEEENFEKAEGMKTVSLSLEEADTYMKLIEDTSKKMAAGVAACIMSPILLILLGGLTEVPGSSISEDMAGGIGVAVLLLIVAGAVATFILLGMKLDKYEYLEKSYLDLQYGIGGIAEKKKTDFEPVYKKCIAAGAALCITSLIPLMLSLAFKGSDFLLVVCVCILLALVAFGVYLFVWAGMIFGSYQKLLEEGDYTREKKLENKKNDNLSKVYWCVVTAAYLGYSFVTGKWVISWVIWPCAGILFAAVCAVVAMIRRK